MEDMHPNKQKRKEVDTLLSNFFSENLVKIDAEVYSPEEAIRTAGNLLVEANKATPDYIDAMVDTFKTIGSYIVLAPNIAMPHARPGEWVKEPCLSFVKLKKPIKFNHPENDPVKLIFALGGVDSDSHINMLKALSLVLSNSEKVEKLKNVKNYDEFINIIQ